MNVNFFIRLSFLLFFSKVPNQEIKMGAKTDSIPTEVIVKNPAKEAIRSNINWLNEKNQSLENEMKRTKATMENFQKRSKKILSESDQKQKKLKKEIRSNQKIIDSLKLELESKDALIVEQVYASIKTDSVQEEKKDSMCVRFGWLTKEKNRTPENCKKWKQLNVEE